MRNWKQSSKSRRQFVVGTLYFVSFASSQKLEFGFVANPIVHTPSLTDSD